MQKKTKAIVFGTPHTIFKDPQISKITINNVGEQTEFVDEVLSLGVILDTRFLGSPRSTGLPKSSINRYLVSDSLSVVLLKLCESYSWDH